LRRLCKLGWFKGLYRKVYEVLSVENALPGPREIKVLDVNDVVGLTSLTPSAYKAYEAAKLIKEYDKNLPAVVGVLTLLYAVFK